MPSNKDNFSFFEIFQHNLMKVSMLPKIGISRIIESGILLKCNQQSTMTPIIRAGGSTGKMSNIFNWSWYFPLLTTSPIKKPFNNHILQQRTFYALWAPDPERLIRMLRVLFFIQSNLNNNRPLSVMKVKVLECIISMEASPLLPKCSLGVPLKSYENKLEFL